MASPSRLTGIEVDLPAAGFDGNPEATAHKHGRLLKNGSPWARQNVLTFDGGGIRGYYSLLHLQYLMGLVAQAERKRPQQVNNTMDGDPSDCASSSFEPCVEPKDFSFSRSAESNFLPCHYFDYISGTSTGALITIMLTTLRMSVADCLHEYENLAEQVFGYPRPLHHAGQLGILFRKNKYSTTRLENAIKDVMRRRGEIAHDHDDAMQFRTPRGLCRAIIFANRSISSGKFDGLWVFRSYDNFSAQLDTPSELPRNPGRGTNLAAWKVARAATAAPLYFKPLEIALDDGEVIRTRKQTTRLSEIRREDAGAPHAITKQRKKQFRTRITALLSDAGLSRANNPSMNVKDELDTIFCGGLKSVANWVSIGTARPKPSQDNSTLKKLLKKTVQEAGDPEGEHKRIEQYASEQGFNYYRLNKPNGLSGVDMDDWKPRRSNDSGHKTIQAMKDAFNEWLAEPGNYDMLNKAAENLVEIRRARTTEFARWERFALGRVFFCPTNILNNCPLDSDETWHYRDSFARHLQTDHKCNDDEINKILKTSYRDWQYKSPDTYS